MKKCKFLLIFTIFVIFINFLLLPNKVHFNSYSEEILIKFIEEKMVKNGGVVTNLKSEVFNFNFASSSEVLSESQGLLMNYYAKTNQQYKFEKILKYTLKNLTYKDNLVYRENFYTNALIDDLRIIDSLLTAYESFNNKYYLKTALKFADNLYKTNVIDDFFVDFYDFEYQIQNDFISLAQVDLSTILKISKYDERFIILYENMLNVLQNGYISDEFPLFYSAYNYNTKKYDTKNLHSAEMLYTLLNLAKVSKLPENSLNYIKNQLENDDIYGSYSVEGIPINNIISTANYAIIMLIATEINDSELYNNTLEKLLNLQIKDENSQLYGAFSDTINTFSFDNLMALISLRS